LPLAGTAATFEIPAKGESLMGRDRFITTSKASAQRSALTCALKRP
jgi:hypothetical protein